MASHAPARICRALALCIVGLALLPAAAAADPTASFNYSPSSPLSLEQITFTSTSSSCPVEIASQSWDLNGDGTFGDANGPTALRSYNRPGSRNVSLRVRDTDGGESIATESVVTGNRAPMPSIAVLPAEPTAGAEITFFSTATDPDGFIASQAWDFDGDGKFDDGDNALATWTFPSVGEFIVRLRVMDDSAAASVVSIGVKVTATMVTLQTSSGPAAASPAEPVPGRAHQRPGEETWRAAADAVGQRAARRPPSCVGCHGKGCPFRRRTQRVRAAAKKPQVPRPVRIRRFAKRLLREGSTIRVFVTGPGSVGKYTRLRVRGGQGARPPRSLPAARQGPTDHLPLAERWRGPGRPACEQLSDADPRRYPVTARA